MFTSTSCVTEHSVHCRVHRGLLYINLVLSIKTYQSINVINIIEHLMLHDSTLKMNLAWDYIYWHISTEKCSMIVTLIPDLHDGWMLVHDCSGYSEKMVYPQSGIHGMSQCAYQHLSRFYIHLEINCTLCVQLRTDLCDYRHCAMILIEVKLNYKQFDRICVCLNIILVDWGQCSIETMIRSSSYWARLGTGCNRMDWSLVST